MLETFRPEGAFTMNRGSKFQKRSSRWSVPGWCPIYFGAFGSIPLGSYAQIVARSPRLIAFWAVRCCEMHHLGVWPFRVATIQARWRSVPQSFSTDSGVPKAVPGRRNRSEWHTIPTILPGSITNIIRRTCWNHTSVSPAALRKCPFGAKRLWFWPRSGNNKGGFLKKVGVS